jgi:hypothetical protein
MTPVLTLQFGFGRLIREPAQRHAARFPMQTKQGIFGEKQGNKKWNSVLVLGEERGHGSERAPASCDSRFKAMMH